jgi:hypothetical protein
LSKYLDDKGLSKLEYSLLVVRTAAYVGLGGAGVIATLVTVLELALPTPRDLIFFGLGGVAIFFMRLIIIPLTMYLERKYPGHFPRKKS